MVKIIKSTISKILVLMRNKKLSSYGVNVSVGRNCVFQGKVYVGSNVSIGSGAHFVSTGARIQINDYVVFGSNVTIYSGDHITSVIGRHISGISQSDKEKMISDKGENIWDKDVLIESGCWIGTQVLILKGVTIGRGSVIGTGSIVTKNISYTMQFSYLQSSDYLPKCA